MATLKNSISASQQRLTEADRPTPQGLGISTTKPKYPQYALASKRRESFLGMSHRWPETAPVGVEDLVEAGLVYTGIDPFTSSSMLFMKDAKKFHDILFHFHAYS